MKILEKACIYVQERDIELLLKASKKENLPKSIVESYEEVIDSGKSNNPLVYRKFEDKDAIAFLNTQSFILDKKHLDYLSWTDTIDYGTSTLLELNKAFHEFELANNSSNPEEIKKAKDRLDLLKYKMNCIKESISDKESRISVVSLKENKKSRLLSKRRNKK